jgi:hypothetical protein
VVRLLFKAMPIHKSSCESQNNVIIDTGLSCIRDPL